MNNNFDIAKKLLQEKGEITGNTSGKSMMPLFRDGRDRAVIVPLTREPRTNDVLLYRKAATNQVILHRVVSTANGLVLRGDGLFRNETDVPSKDILGVMKSFYRNGKYYECQKSLSYKLYVAYIRSSYPIRLTFHRVLSLAKRALRKIKNSA